MNWLNTTPCLEGKYESSADEDDDEPVQEPS